MKSLPVIIEPSPDHKKKVKLTFITKRPLMGPQLAGTYKKEPNPV